MGEEDCDSVYYEIHSVNETPQSSFTIYPNPAHSTLFVIPNNVIPSSFHLTTLLGQTVASGLITSNSHQIDVQSLPSGMYFLTIGNQTQKIIINP